MTITQENSMCRCGNQRSSPLVTPKARYSKLGVLSWIIGVSPRPQRIELTCSRCGHIFETITDPKKCEEFRYYPG